MSVPPTNGVAVFFGFFEFIPVILLGLIILAVATAASGRQEPDPTGRRPYAIYLVSITFVAIQVLVFSATAVVTALVQIPLRNDVSVDALGVTVAPEAVSGSGTATIAPPKSSEQPSPEATLTESPPPQPSPVEIPPPRPIQLDRFNADTRHVREAIQAGFIAVVALLMLLFHARRLRDLTNEPGFAEGPARRAYQAYLYAVCFVSVLTALAAAAVASIGLVNLIAPQTVVEFERDNGIRQFVTGAFLALASSVIFRFHWRRASAFRTPPPEEPRPETAPPV
jgi:hypothetical protein